MFIRLATDDLAVVEDQWSMWLLLALEVHGLLGTVIANFHLKKIIFAVNCIENKNSTKWPAMVCLFKNKRVVTKEVFLAFCINFFA